MFLALLFVVFLILYAVGACCPPPYSRGAHFILVLLLGILGYVVFKGHLKG